MNYELSFVGELVQDIRLFILRPLVELFLDNLLGHLWIKIFFWPTVEWFLLPVSYATLRCFGPLLANTPVWFRDFWQNTTLFLSIVLNCRIILDILFEAVASFVIVAVGVRYNQQMRNDVQIFLRLATPVKENNTEYYKANMGTGRERDPENSFFPQALTSGPRKKDPFWSNDPSTRQLHNQIAQSCAFFSILCYQNAKNLRRCMDATGMLPNVAFYTVTTGPSETDLYIFVDKDKKWAVFCFRGTEPETIRDWLTSILVIQPTTFCKTTDSSDETVKWVRSRYYEEMISAIHGYPVQPNPSVGRQHTTIEFAQSLWKKNDCKVYFTGHSLGGGLATLMGAYTKAQSLVNPAAVITFGSPPVAANQAFLDWYNSELGDHSWRFVNRNEFAPLAPPLPFTTKYVFFPVSKLIQAQDLSNRNPTVLTRHQEVEKMDSLFWRLQLVSLFVDHNPVLTLQALKGRFTQTNLTVKR